MRLDSFYFMFGFLMLFSISGNAQVLSTENDTRVFVIRDSVSYFSESNFNGTYQIIHRSKTFEIFTFDIYFEIESRRRDYEVVLWDISPETTIRIFPRNLTFPPSNYRITETEIME